MTQSTKTTESTLPYSCSNPIFYDNDSHEDVYTDEYLLALASSGDIDLRGMVTSASYVDAWQKAEVQYELQADGREERVGRLSWSEKHDHRRLPRRGQSSHPSTSLRQIECSDQHLHVTPGEIHRRARFPS